MRLIPSIDLRGGRCVRLLRGDFDAETQYDISARELLDRYRAMGAPWIHLVDLDGARDGRIANRATVQELAAQSGIALQVGGGVRSREVASDLLNLGVARLVVGSAAVDTPDAVTAWIREFGAERLCLGLDVVHHDSNGMPLLRTHGWRGTTNVTLWEGVERFLDCGLRHVLCTDIDRDGALAGPNVTLYIEAVRRYPTIQWQASGGIANLDDLRALAASGAAAAISGRALLENQLSAEGLQPYLLDA